ncbi:hypothetical protein NEOC65_000575 [Neochlamydia sp. AcF65]|nr:hypothetical protein [Neochlamydia sp. AcF65]MBS4169505.1 hypothetical protein [Neochlamydia sp. AcF95]
MTKKIFLRHLYKDPLFRFYQVVYACCVLESIPHLPLT